MEDPDLVALIRRGYDALSRQDFEALGEFTAPDLEFQRAEGMGVLEGRDAALDFARPDAFEWQRFEPVDLTSRGDRVLVTLRVRARGKGSGIEVVDDVFHVLTFRDRRVARLEVYFDGSEAREAFERSA